LSVELLLDGLLPDGLLPDGLLPDGLLPNELLPDVSGVAVAGCSVPVVEELGCCPGAEFADGSVVAVATPLPVSLPLMVPWPGAIGGLLVGLLGNWQFISDPSKPQRRTLTIGMSGKRV